MSRFYGSLCICLQYCVSVTVACAAFCRRVAPAVFSDAQNQNSHIVWNPASIARHLRNHLPLQVYCLIGRLCIYVLHRL